VNVSVITGGSRGMGVEAMLSAQTALGRVGGPEDVARVIATLLSEDTCRVSPDARGRRGLHDLIKQKYQPAFA